LNLISRLVGVHEVSWSCPIYLYGELFLTSSVTSACCVRFSCQLLHDCVAVKEIPHSFNLTISASASQPLPLYAALP